MLRNFFYLIMKIILGGFIMEKQDIINYVLNTPENTNPAVLKGMLEQLESGGGGGESDFTTAEVTFVLPEGTEEVDSFAFIQTVDEGEGEPASVFVGIAPITTNAKRNVPLYKGLTAIMLSGFADSGYTIGSVSGDAEYNNITGILMITGDCTITLVAK